MKFGADYTREQIRNMAFALRADQWIITLVLAAHEPLRGRSEVIRTSYNFQKLLHPDTIGFLRGRNAEGYHIYGRPDATQYILVDDLCADALDQMRKEGHKPAAVVMTSARNYQAWISVAKEPIPDAQATAIAKLLAHRYGGDPGAAKSTQPGRLPGMTNRKETRMSENGLYPFTELKVCMKYPQMTNAARGVLVKAQEMLSAPSSSPSFTRKGRALGEVFETDLTTHEAAMLYHDAENHLHKLFGRNELMKTDGTSDRSRIDHAVARHLALNGTLERDCAAIIMAGSEKAKERGLPYVHMLVGKLYGKPL